MRCTVLLAILGAVILALANMAVLLGNGYARVAERSLTTPTRARAVSASTIAARLPPWSSSRLALKGWALNEELQSDAANATYVSALRLAPADPLLWAEYAQARAQAGQFDESLTLAVRRATTLAPQSPAVQNAIADLGLVYWPRGNPDQRAIWLEAMRYELIHARASFLGHVMTRGRGQTFCTGPAATLGEDKWCTSIAPALLSGCFTIDKEPVPCKMP